MNADPSMRYTRLELKCQTREAGNVSERLRTKYRCVNWSMTDFHLYPNPEIYPPRSNL